MDTLRRLGYTNAQSPPRGGDPEKVTGGGIGHTVKSTLTSPSMPSAHPSTIARITLWTRCAAAALYFLALIVAIVAASFQKKWVGAPSGLTGFLLFTDAAFILLLGLFILVPVLADRGTGGKRIAELERALREDRVGFLGHGFCLVLGLIVAVTQLISTLGAAACKDPSSDDHAKSSTGKEEDYVSALGGFCHTKRAEAAFLWLGWLGFAVLAVLFLVGFRQSRKAGPRIPPFVHPHGESEEDAQPLKGGEPQDEGHHPAAPDSHYNPYESNYDPQSTATPMIPGRYGGDFAAPQYGNSAPTYVNPLSDIEARYGLHSQHARPMPPHQDYQVQYEPPVIRSFDRYQETISYQQSPQKLPHLQQPAVQVSSASSDGHGHASANPFADALANVRHQQDQHLNQQPTSTRARGPPLPQPPLYGGEVPPAHYGYDYKQPIDPHASARRY